MAHYVDKILVYSAGRAKEIENEDTLEVTGSFTTGGYLRVGTFGSPPTPVEGGIYYDGSAMKWSDGLTWQSFGGGSVTLQQAYAAGNLITLTANRDFEIAKPTTGVASIVLNASAASSFIVDGANFNISTTGVDAPMGLGTAGASLLSLFSGAAVSMTATTTIGLQGTTGVSINATGGAINLGNLAYAQPINIGTGAAARTITVGNTTGATSVALTSGTGGTSINSTGAVDIATSATTGAVNIGTSATNRTITIGNNSSLTGVVIRTGATNFSLIANGVSSQVSTDIFYTDSSGASVNIGTGAYNSAINLGTGGARAINIGTYSATGAITIANGSDITIQGTSTTTVSGTNLTAYSGNTTSIYADTSLLLADSSTTTPDIQIGTGAGKTRYIQIGGGLAPVSLGVSDNSNPSANCSNIGYKMYSQGGAKFAVAQAVALSPEDESVVVAVATAGVDPYLYKVIGVALESDSTTSSKICTVHGTLVELMLSVAPAKGDTGVTVYLDPAAPGYGTYPEPTGTGDHIVKLGTLLSYQTTGPNGGYFIFFHPEYVRVNL